MKKGSDLYVCVLTHVGLFIMVLISAVKTHAEMRSTMLWFGSPPFDFELRVKATEGQRSKPVQKKASKNALKICFVCIRACVCVCAFVLARTCVCVCVSPPPPLPP